MHIHIVSQAGYCVLTMYVLTVRHTFVMYTCLFLIHPHVIKRLDYAESDSVDEKISFIAFVDNVCDT